MKRIIFVILSVFVTTAICAQSFEVKRVINKFDKPYLRKADGFERPDLFWETIGENDTRAKKLVSAYKKNDKDVLKIAEVMQYYLENNRNYDFLVSGYDSIVSKLVDDLGIHKIVADNPIMVIRDYDVNAYMDIVDQMRINYGCFERLTYGQLLAVCAHEVAHSMCEHVPMRLWKSAKKERRNKMWADIGASIAVGAIAATSAYGVSVGYEAKEMNEILKNADLIYYGSYDYAQDATLKYTCRYSRDEETEADIVAYRFMEQLGYGGEHVLSMLNKLMELYGDTPLGKYDDHPTTTFRIQVITAMMNGYSGKY